MTDSEDLSASNNQRVLRALSGQLGIQVNPIQFDLARLTVYLETLLGDSLPEAQLSAEQRIAAILDQMEQVAQQARIRAGVGFDPASAGNILQLRER